MTDPIPINVGFEDSLTESVMLKVLRTIPTTYAVRTVYNRGGYGYLRRMANAFITAARSAPFLIATDLDNYPCPSGLISDWLFRPRHHNFLIRIAVREAEAWILADREGFARFLGIGVTKVPGNVESLQDPKAELIRLARQSRSRSLQEDICPRAGSTSKVGPNYNSRLGAFVNADWDASVARMNSRSLDGAIRCLVTFRPHWPIVA